MTETQVPKSKPRWRRAPELPEDVFAVLRKPNRMINPVTIVATADADGAPRTAPFGSVRAVTPRLLRLISARYHDTYQNMARDGRVSVAVLAPPDIAVSIRGRARVVRAPMQADADSVLVDIDIEEVKNDMVRSGVIESGIGFHPLAELQQWFDAAIGEAEDLAPTSP